MSQKIVDNFIEKYGRLPTERDRDYLEMLRMSKYRIVAVPDVTQARCANCGSSKGDGRNYVDFGLHVDFYGAVFLCGECVKDIALNMGVLKAYELKILQLEKKIEEDINARVGLDEFRATVLNTFEEVTKRFDVLVDRSDRSSHSLGSLGLGLESDKPPVIPPTNGTDQDLKRSKQGITKQATSSGSKDVPSLAALLKLDE